MQRSGIARFAGALATAALLFGAGCASTPDEQSLARGSESGEFRDGLGADGIEGSEIPERTPDLGTVYFDYDRHQIRDDARPVLRSNAKAIQGNAEWRTVTLEGHCDERGSEEYNLALGEKRANATKSYLVDLGVPAGQIVTVSFGESMPAVQGHDESAWRWNRRVEFRVSR